MSIVSRFLNRDASSRQQPLDTIDIVLEPLRKKHLRDVLAIEERVYPRPWTAGVFSSELDQVRRGQRFYVAATRRGELVGYGGIMLLPDEAHVTNIAVHPDEQRRGVGRQLLARLIREARRQGLSSLSLEVRASNTAAQAMYRSFGFGPAGVRQRYYEGVEDAIVMWAHDIDRPEYDDLLRRREVGG
jgi:[ribosomal protein S18]-alanine N-acetyltransferase